MKPSNDNKRYAYYSKTALKHAQDFSPRYEGHWVVILNSDSDFSARKSRKIATLLLVGGAKLPKVFADAEPLGVVEYVLSPSLNLSKAVTFPTFLAAPSLIFRRAQRAYLRLIFPNRIIFHTNTNNAITTINTNHGTPL